VIKNTGEPLMPAEFRYEDYPAGVTATAMFPGPTQVIREEQRSYVEEELGIRDCLSGEELRELLTENNRRAVESYREYLETGQGETEEKISTCEKLVLYYQETLELDKQLAYILKSFEYDIPRAEFCCHFGLYFLSLRQYEKGIFWYKLASQLEKPAYSRLMWLPHVQLCVCYDRLEKYELAYEHNEIARI
jgi:hypothetical protein